MSSFFSFPKILSPFSRDFTKAGEKFLQGRENLLGQLGSQLTADIVEVDDWSVDS